MSDRDAAPAGLSTEAREWWRRITAEFELDAGGLLVLGAALESFDRAAEARALIAVEGLTVEGRYGPRAHPMVAVERDARAAMVRGLKSLGLELEPILAPGRPAGGRRAN